MNHVFITQKKHTDRVYKPLQSPLHHHQGVSLKAHLFQIHVKEPLYHLLLLLLPVYLFIPNKRIIYDLWSLLRYLDELKRCKKPFKAVMTQN